MEPADESTQDNLPIHGVRMLALGAHSTCLAATSANFRTLGCEASQNQLNNPAGPSELFMIKDPNGKEYSGSGHVEDAAGEGILKSDSFLSHFDCAGEGNAMRANYMDQLHLKSMLSFPSPPVMVEERWMLEDVRGLIDFPKGPDQFKEDEDFYLWLSTL